MREIKFRAWIKKEKQIKRVDEIGISEGWVEVQGGIQPYLFGDINLMQYTGLKDKNGVEIYEGDIFFDGIESCVIEWHRTTVSFLANDGDESHGISSFCEYEIIGNIYENPELLK